jgi:hypothetical protein
MPESLNTIIYRNPQVSKTVNYFKSKLKLIEKENEEKFQMNNNLILTYNDYYISYKLMGDISKEIEIEINQYFKDSLIKYS